MDYFTEGKRTANLILIYTLQIALKYFELIDYIETKPIKSSQNIDLEKYKITTTLPTFIILKLRKK